ncbi:MAG: OmpA family protein [Betaproteobacteria bacterium]
MTKKTNSLSILMGAILLATGTMASAQPANTGTAEKSAYVTDQRNVVVRNSTGLCWRTGYWTPAQAIAECDPDLMPKQVAVATQTERAPLPTPAGQKLTLAADTLFDFDKAVLRPQGRDKLNELVKGMGDIRLELITAVGHTDRIGTDAYNQRLSERRAQAVKAYLVSQGVDANRIQVEGRGEKQPVTGDACKNMGRESGRNRKLVDCLQPDRRVDVEVIGTRAPEAGQGSSQPSQPQSQPRRQ